MKKAIRKSCLAFAASVCLAASAHADEAACPDQTGKECPPSRTWRESLDQARNDLAASFGNMQLSAFGDVLSGYDDNGKQKLNWGSFELDATADLSHDLQGALAVVNSRGASTTLAAGFLDYHTFGGRIAPRGRLWAEKGFHVQVGRFDVPFGNDWQFFASKDSVSISRPLTTELVMGGGYNDKGMRILGNNGTVNFNTYLLRGFSGGRLLGGRIGLMPFNVPFSPKESREPKIGEFGLAYLHNIDASGKKDETAFAADAEMRLGAWSGRYEYMIRKREPLPGELRTVLSGWHFTQEYELGETIPWQTKLFARYEYGATQPAEIATPGAGAGDDHDVRVAVGSSSNLGNSDVVQLKFEVQHYRAATPSTRALPGFGRSLLWFTQLVVVL